MCGRKIFYFCYSNTRLHTCLIRPDVIDLLQFLKVCKKLLLLIQRIVEIEVLAPQNKNWTLVYGFSLSETKRSVFACVFVLSISLESYLTNALNDLCSVFVQNKLYETNCHF